MASRIPSHNKVIERLHIWSNKSPENKLFLKNQDEAFSYKDIFKLIKKLDIFTGEDQYEIALIYMPHSIDLASLLLLLMSKKIIPLVVEKSTPYKKLDEVFSKVAPKYIISQKLHRDFFSNLSVYLLKETSLLMPIDIYINRVPKRHMNLSKNNIATILMTSGSTGSPKFVMIDHEDIGHRAIGEANDFELRQADNVLNVLSYSHDIGFNQLCSSIVAGASLSIFNIVSPYDLFKLLKRDIYTGFSATPHILRLLLSVVPKEMHCLSSSIRYLAISGGTLEKSKIEQLLLILPNAKIIKTYGQTEVFRSLIRTEKKASDSAGVPLSGVAIKLLGDSQTAELWHKGVGVMKGYLFGEDEDKFYEGGIKTGDFFSKSAHGEYKYVGRKDRMIKKNDHRVYPEGIEKRIGSFEAIKASVVICEEVNSNTRIVLFVLLNDFFKKNEEDFLKKINLFFQKNLHKYEIPDEVIILEEMPLLNNGKIDIRRLSSMRE